MKISESEWLEHSGTPQQFDFDPNGSGRYRQGSGDDPYQHAKEFRDRVAKIRADYRKQNGRNPSPKEETEAFKNIADEELVRYFFGSSDKVTIRTFRNVVTRTKAETMSETYLEAHKLKEKGYSKAAIGEQIGMSATNVEKLLQRDTNARANKLNNTVSLLKESLDTKGGYIDVGPGSELLVGVGKSTMDAAVKMLENEGYVRLVYPVQQLFGKGNTNVTLICPPGTQRKDIFKNMDKVRDPVDVHVDVDGNACPLRPVQSIDSKRIMVNYAEDGGKDKDGVIEIRRGVEDLPLGNARYAQVRIAVDGTHYMKGMAVYADDLPDGVDVRFNTNKKRGTPLIDADPDAKQVLKPMADPNNKLNPFGAAIKGAGQGQRGAINIVNEEGDWSKWSKTLASQFLSKQFDATISKQLKATKAVAQAEFEEICSLTNPTLKRYFLEQFANSCDADAVDLKAIRMPGQTQKVLLPVPSSKEKECYCPTLPDGTEVALVRYPHGGVFEIPVLTVNNNNAEAQRVMGTARDAIGIHPSQAGVLSGADFDGDTVMVLPLTGSFKLKRKPPLEGLKDFEPKVQFNGDHLDPKDKMKKSGVQNAMGSISNLITDMTVLGADDKELERAVAHSMVVIDAYKHGLDYKASEKYFDIAGLRRKYQPVPEGSRGKGGASTLLSRAKSPYYYLDRREKPKSRLTPEELERWKKGEKIYEPTGKMVYSKKAQAKVLAEVKGTKMGEIDDAYKLSSGSRPESYYADYANFMKDLANKARAELRATGKLEYSPTAFRTYNAEVVSLKEKLENALRNSPRERKAQLIANSTWLIEKDQHPEWNYRDDKEKIKRAKSRHLEAARMATGAKKPKVSITAREWEAIQSGAIHDTTLLKILNNADSAEIRKLAMPKGTSISPSKLARAKSLYASGQSWADIAEILGVPQSTLMENIE